MKSLQDQMKAAENKTQVTMIWGDVRNARFMSGKTYRRIERIANQKMREFESHK